MIKITGLVKRYKGNEKDTIGNISFEFPSNGLYYLVGESGSGKSTLLKIIAGIDQEYEGIVEVDSLKVNSLKKRNLAEYLRKSISLCLQEDELEYELSVKDNLLLSLEIFDYPYGAKEEMINKICSKLGLIKNLDSKVSLLSGGEIKRVNLARALVKDTPIYLLDEPLGPLHKDMRKKIISLLEEISQKSLVIVISHNTNEIDKDSNIIRMVDGKINVVNKVSSYSTKRIDYNVGRVRYRFSSIVVSIIKKLKVRMKHTMFSIFATSLALTSLGMISIISTSVNESIKTYLSGTIDKNALVIKQKNVDVIHENFVSSSSYNVNRIKNKYSKYIFETGAYYKYDFENTFINSNKSYITFDKSILSFPSISIRNFSEFTYYKELNEDESFSFMELNNDEICLGLDENNISLLASILNLSTRSLIDINEYLLSNDLAFHLDLEASIFKYSLEMTFLVRQVVKCKRNKIIHINPNFNEQIIEEEMRFIPSVYDGTYEVPWMIYKSNILYSYPLSTRSFLDEISLNKEFDNLIFIKLQKEYQIYYEDNNIMTHDRIMVLDDYVTKLSCGEVNDIVSKYRSQINSYYYTNGLYFYSSEGMYSGFLKPVYLSSKKEMINELIDYNYEASFNAQGFQGATITTSEDIVSGDAINSSSSSGLNFKSYLSPPKPEKGYLPSNNSEVLISSALADVIFKNKRYFLDSMIYLTCLTSTEYQNGGYKNIFKDGELKVTGVVNSDELLLYQAPKFILSLGEDQFNISKDEQRINQVIINFKDGINHNDILSTLSSEYNTYDFSFPSLEISKGVDEIVGYVSSGLLAFGIFTGLISIILLTLVVFLFIKDDSNKIRLLLLEGYLVSDIKRYYYFLSFLIGLLSFINSSISLLVIGLVFKNGLTSFLEIEIKSIDLSVFFLNFVISFVFSLISVIFVSNKISRVNLAKNYI